MTPGVQTLDQESAYRHRRQRDHAEHMLDMAEHFAEADRLLVEQIYRFGLSLTDVGRLTDQSRRSVQRRIARLAQRARDPLFRFVLARWDLIPTDVQPVARRAVLQGHSLRDTARLTGRTLHEVRQDMQAIQTLFRVH